MEVVRLNPVSYLPDSLIEGYTSMIWTERYDGNGEFEMRNAKVDEIRSLLPEGSLISLVDSKEVMIVETHSISVNDQGVAESTITGRTFETFLENRIMYSQYYGETWFTPMGYNVSNIVSVLLWNALVNASGQDPTKPSGQPMDIGMPLNNVAVTDSTSPSGAVEPRELKSGPVLDQILEFMSLYEYGIRNIRPANTTANIITVDTSSSGTRGTVIRSLTPNIPKLRVDLYEGTDRSLDQSGIPCVIFHYDSGHIESPSYLFSIKNYKNVAVVGSSLGRTIVVGPDAPVFESPSYSPLDARVLYIDAGDLSALTNAEALQVVNQKATIELKKNNRAAIFDGAISPISTYKYNSDYFLGDKVSLLAQYGYRATMRVTEYVRIEDKQGDRGYPTLILAS